MPLLPHLVSADHVLAILLALLGAALLAIGTHAQHAAVNRPPSANRRHGPPPPRSLRGLLVSPLWLVGGALIVLETVFNVVALALAPVALIQPLGTASLVIAVLLTALSARRPTSADPTGASRSTAYSPTSRSAASSPAHPGTVSSPTGSSPVTRRMLLAVALVVASVTVFVAAASRHMEASPASDGAAAVLAGGMLALSAVGVLVARSRIGHTIRVLAAGVLFGGVASGTHVVGVLLLTGDGLPPAAWAVGTALAPASAVGVWLVQTAYARGSAASVLAGLTVVDPITAVLIGGVVLGEFGAVPPGALALLTLSGAGALWGVTVLAQCRPGSRPTPTSPVMSAPADNMEGARGEGVPAHP